MSKKMQLRYRALSGRAGSPRDTVDRESIALFFIARVELVELSECSGRYTQLKHLGGDFGLGRRPASFPLGYIEDGEMSRRVRPGPE